MRYLPVSALIIVIAVLLFFSSTPVGVAHTLPCAQDDCQCMCVAMFQADLDVCGISHEKPADIPPPPVSDAFSTECILDAVGSLGELNTLVACILACQPQEHE